MEVSVRGGVLLALRWAVTDVNEHKKQTLHLQEV